jgi:hypothetical protein
MTWGQRRWVNLFDGWYQCPMITLILLSRFDLMAPGSKRQGPIHSQDR